MCVLKTIISRTVWSPPINQKKLPLSRHQRAAVEPPVNIRLIPKREKKNIKDMLHSIYIVRCVIYAAKIGPTRQE